MTRTHWNSTTDPDAPLRWRKPRQVQVTLTGAETDAELDRLFAVMALAKTSAFEVLADDADSIYRWLNYASKFDNTYEEICDLNLRLTGDWSSPVDPSNGESFPNVAISTTCHTQAEVDRAVPSLLSMPNAHPWLRIEPSERISVAKAMHSARTAGLKTTGLSQRQAEDLAGTFHGLDGLRYIELSGQTGPDAAPMHPSWAREIRDECQAAGVQFRFEGWGEWGAVYDRDRDDPDWRRCDVFKDWYPNGRWLNLQGGQGFHGEQVVFAAPVGPRKSGRILDGVTHDGQIEFNQNN